MTSNAENRSVATTFAYCDDRFLLCAGSDESSWLRCPIATIHQLKIYFSVYLFSPIRFIAFVLRSCSADVWRKTRVCTMANRESDRKKSNGIMGFLHTTMANERPKGDNEKEREREIERPCNRMRKTVKSSNSNVLKLVGFEYVWMSNVQMHVQELDWKRPIDNEGLGGREERSHEYESIKCCTSKHQCEWCEYGTRFGYYCPSLVLLRAGRCMHCSCLLRSKQKKTLRSKRAHKTHEFIGHIDISGRCRLPALRTDVRWGQQFLISVTYTHYYYYQL